MRRRLALLIGAALVVAVPGLGAAASAPALDARPTKVASQAKAAGLTRAGPRYRYREQRPTSDEGRLLIELPTAWSDIVDSRLRHPDTDQPYGVGIRATTDAARWNSTFDVPGVRIAATTQVPPSPDPAELITANTPQGCRAGAVRNYDNGTYAGKYELFSRCDGKKLAEVIVSALNPRGDVIVLLVARARTKADLAAVDHALRTASFEKPAR